MAPGEEPDLGFSCLQTRAILPKATSAIHKNCQNCAVGAPSSRKHLSACPQAAFNPQILPVPIFSLLHRIRQILGPTVPPAVLLLVFSWGPLSQGWPRGIFLPFPFIQHLGVPELRETQLEPFKSQ